MNTDLKEAQPFGKIQGDHIILMGAEPKSTIEAFAKNYANKNITVFDTQQPHEVLQLPNLSYFIESKVDRLFQSDFFDYILKNLPVVLTNSNSWVGREDQLSYFFSVLTGRNPRSFELHLVEFGFDIKALPQREGLLSMKDVFLTVKPEQLQKSAELLILRELIR